MSGPEFEERQSLPEEASRGAVLHALADGGLWAFLILHRNSDGTLRLKVEQDEVLDLEGLRGLLTRVLEGLP